MPLTRTPCTYSRVDKEDPEEVFHRRAQFLIYKRLEEADFVSRRPTPSRRWLPYLQAKLCGLNAKIGKSMTKLQRSLAAALFGVNKHFVGGFKAWKRMFRGGAATGLPPPIFALEV